MALMDAVRLKNLPMVKWLCDRFSGFIVGEDVISETVTEGSMEILEFFYDNDCGIHRLGDGKGHRVEWGGHTMANAISAGRHDAVWWLHYHTHAYFNLDAALSAAVCKGDIVMADWLINISGQGDVATAHHDTMHRVAAQGRIDLVKWLAEGVGFDDGTLVVAATIGHLKLVRWLFNPNLSCFGQRNQPPLKGIHCEMKFAIHAAAVNGHLEAAKFLREKSKEMGKRSRRQDAELLERLSSELSSPYEAAAVSAKTMTGAARNGHLRVVKWLLEEYRDEVDLFQTDKTRKKTRGSVDGGAMDAAASSGQLDVLKYLHELQLACSPDAKKRKRDKPALLSSPQCTEAAMDGAAANGHLDVVQWLHEHRTEGCSARAMDRAAAGGHLKIVRWLKEHRSEGCTSAAMDNAAAKGHLRVVQWLHENSSVGCTKKAMDRAASNGHLDVVKWLHANRAEGCTTAAMNGAAQRGHLNVVKWLHRNRKEGCTTLAMDNAAREGHLRVVQWLHTHRTEGWSHSAIDFAAESDHFEVFLYIHSQCQEKCTVQTALKARESRAEEIHEWILRQYQVTALNWSHDGVSINTSESCVSSFVVGTGFRPSW